VADVNGINGDIVNLRATHPTHFGIPKRERVEKEGEDFISEFSRALKDAFYRVNESERLTQALAVRPDTVDIHDVTIAAEKARIALLFTKSIVDRVTQGYRELINVR
jgi:flagellar hook-basal body complex protein FliE